MKRNLLTRKFLIYEVIVLLLIMNLMRIAGSTSSDPNISPLGGVKNIQSIAKTGPLDIYVTLRGNMGENSWFIGSEIWIDVTATNGSEVTAVYYQLDGSAWQEYNGPWLWTIDPEGIHSLNVRVEDQYGGSWDFHFELKIDLSKPTITLHKQFMLFHEIKFIADVSDLPSGIWRVEFYLDDELQVIDDVSPFEWIWAGTVNRTVTAKVFDRAGHTNNCSMNTSYIHDQHLKIFSLQRFNQLLLILKEMNQ